MNSFVGKKNDVVGTPEWLYQELDQEFHFDFDPCPLDWDPSKPDGLKIEWGQRNWVNPPFSDIPAWIAKALEARDKGKLVVMLLTARINTNYWFENVWPKASEIRFINRVLTFKGYKHPFPIPVCIVVFDPARGPLAGVTFGEFGEWGEGQRMVKLG